MSQGLLAACGALPLSGLLYIVDAFCVNGFLIATDALSLTGVLLTKDALQFVERSFTWDTRDSGLLRYDDTLIYDNA